MLDALTLDQMRAFVAVVESGSFRSAAERLSRVQSAVSHAVATMEAELGLTLLDRSGHRAKLTPEGQALLPDMRDILLKSQFLRARARGLGEGVELGLSIVVDTLFPIAVAGGALQRMRQHYPSVTVNVRVAALGGPLAALQAKRATLAITVGENFRDPAIQIEAVLPVPLVSVVGASHPLAARAQTAGPVLAVELAEHLQIVIEDPTPMTEGRDIGVLSPGTWRVGSQDLKHALIVAGLGWGRLPLWQVERDLAEKRLVRVDAAALGRGGRSVAMAYLAHRLDEPLGPAGRAFRSAVLEDKGALRTGRN
jgi:DNA-binding transcriptional LysR family regulator